MEFPTGGSTPLSPSMSSSSSSEGRPSTSKKVSSDQLNKAFANALTAKGADQVRDKDARLLLGFLNNQARNPSWLNAHQESCDRLMRVTTKLYVMGEYPDSKIMSGKICATINRILERNYPTLAAKLPDDLVLVTDTGERVAASALLLMHASKAFVDILTRNYEEGRRLFATYPINSQYSPVEIMVHDVSAPALQTLITFLKTHELRQGAALSAEDLISLCRNIPYWQFTSQAEEGTFKTLLQTQIMEKHLTMESALEWYDIASNPTIQLPELESACVETLSQLNSGEGLDELMRATAEAYPDAAHQEDKDRLLVAVISKMSLDPAAEPPAERLKIYALLRRYGTAEQIRQCAASIDDEILLEVLEGKLQSEGLVDAIACCNALLQERIKGWERALGKWDHNIDSPELRGRKGKLGRRHRLNAAAKAGLQRVVRLAPNRLDEGLLSALSEPMKMWMLKHNSMQSSSAAASSDHP